MEIDALALADRLTQSVDRACEAMYAEHGRVEDPLFRLFVEMLKRLFRALAMMTAGRRAGVVPAEAPSAPRDGVAEEPPAREPGLAPRDADGLAGVGERPAEDEIAAGPRVRPARTGAGPAANGGCGCEAAKRAAAEDAARGEALVPRAVWQRDGRVGFARIEVAVRGRRLPSPMAPVRAILGGGFQKRGVHAARSCGHFVTIS